MIVKLLFKSFESGMFEHQTEVRPRRPAGVEFQRILNRLCFFIFDNPKAWNMRHS